MIWYLLFHVIPKTIRVTDTKDHVTIHYNHETGEGKLLLSKHLYDESYRLRIHLN